MSELDDWTYTVETVRREDVERLKGLLAMPVRELVIDWPDDDPPIPQPKGESCGEADGRSDFPAVMTRRKRTS